MNRRISGALVGLMLFTSVGPTRAAGGTGSIVDAVRKRDVAAVKALLKQPGAASVATPDGTTPLHVATDLDDVAIAQLLVSAGANVKAVNRYGVTPMYSAAV